MKSATAVEVFAGVHEALDEDATQYRALIPRAEARPGQQYAFEVDLDACTGCKACVTGCHSMNDLDEGEVWRTVGLLNGGSAQAPAQQTITTSCHHCVEPACMLGCPARAYEKDPRTGIVKHLDDACIGCQYCTFTCPYDAPKFNRARGIVRKCDMCSDRLAKSEAPACVLACPNEAIRITVVAEAEVVEAAQASAFVPGTAPPTGTLPTTSYVSKRALPRNLLPADFYDVHRQHSHPPLIAMLVLTQLSAGTFAVAWAARVRDRVTALVACAAALAAMGASLFHLGRPARAYRAILGLATSWLSREIVAFSGFAGLASAYAASYFVAPLARFSDALEMAVVVSGAVAVGCSIMVYVATRRGSWNAVTVSWKFLGTALVLGAATVLATTTLTGATPSRALLATLVAGTAAKLALELGALVHLADRQHSAKKRTAVLLAGELLPVTWLRVACGLAGGITPALLPLGGGGAIVVFALVVTGELAERYLFFSAAAAPKMPGVP
jgi:Fe-S-cluster-containing dehydrogenase component/DMSO reductase anchor subunit